ncbi:aminotransferase class V-fold PLP-dependent enzyme [Bacillus massilinigeriensis]|uniref:aminotransferase class V-fold PLP-dependent enzyme n=1 Tax=Bacillus mediterraneensis TaxID=1805474 RepID=UPI0008F82631|nr:aminotransferase class V-fold PLP-dependent enzyme [Bacillus mediterraneensis]
MYWCKIARTDREFAEIAKLNYETFSEEIPQHEKNETGLRVDRFHEENTYILVYKNTVFAGMVALRDKRPFSLDEKIGRVENFLPGENTSKLCEIRLLSVKKVFRTGRVFRRLMGAICQFAYDRGYAAAVISGTTREEKLYKGMGFTQFADTVGNADARFLPMVLTRERFEDHLKNRLGGEIVSFYPGPVEQKDTLKHTGLSHRSDFFRRLFDRVKSKLLVLSQANNVSVLVGSGTLANDVMLGQLKTGGEKGLILSNGEFGGRLIAQAERWELNYETIEQKWGVPFDESAIRERLDTGTFGWLLFVHGETSTGTCNNFTRLSEIAGAYGVKLCADCISTFGAMPFSMKDLYLATTASGKAIGAVSGLAFVFSRESAKPSRIPVYLDLYSYQTKSIPFTIPAVLLDNVAEALSRYPERYSELQKRYDLLCETDIVKNLVLDTPGYPMIVTLELPLTLSGLGEDLMLNGLYVHANSSYLRERSYIQLSIIQPGFESALAELEEIYQHYIVVSKKEKAGALI